MRVTFNWTNDPARTTLFPKKPTAIDRPVAEAEQQMLIETELSFMKKEELHAKGLHTIKCDDHSHLPDYSQLNHSFYGDSRIWP